MVNHRFEPVSHAEWRNAALGFPDPPSLLRSSPAPYAGLKSSKRPLDETTPPDVPDEDIIVRAKDRSAPVPPVGRLPDAGLPQDDDGGPCPPGRHDVRVLTAGRRRVDEDWLAAIFRIDRTDGEIDTLSTRLASVRTWPASPTGRTG